MNTTKIMTGIQKRRMNNLKRKIIKARRLLDYYNSQAMITLSEDQKRRVLMMEADLLLLDAESKQMKLFKNGVPL